MSQRLPLWTAARTSFAANASRNGHRHATGSFHVPLRSARVRVSTGFSNIRLGDYNTSLGSSASESRVVGRRVPGTPGDQPGVEGVWGGV
eukprot:6612437-Pyramimonas_sp.AAC.3